MINITKNIKYYKLLNFKYYAYLLNVEPNNLLFLETYDNDFDEILMTFTSRNVRPLEKDGKVDIWYSIEPRKKNMLKDVEFLHLLKIYLKSNV